MESLESLVVCSAIGIARTQVMVAAASMLAVSQTTRDCPLEMGDERKGEAVKCLRNTGKNGVIRFLGGFVTTSNDLRQRSGATLSGPSMAGLYGWWALGTTS